MKKLGVVLIVFAGLQAIIQAPAFLDAVLSVVRSADAMGTRAGVALAAGVLPVVVSVLLGLWLISRRHILASRWFDDSEMMLSVDGVSLLRIALVVTGVVMVAEAVPGFLFAITNGIAQAAIMQSQIASLGDGADSQWGLWLASVSTAVYPLVSFGIGVVLIRRSDSVSRRLWTVPEPTPKASSHEDEQAHCPTCDEPYNPADYVSMDTAKCSSCGQPLKPPPSA